MDPELTLNGIILSFKQSTTHLGVVMDSGRQSIVTAEARVRKFFGGVSTVLGRSGILPEKVWMTIIDRSQLRKVANKSRGLRLYKPRPSCGYYSRAAFMYTYRIESIDTVTDVHLQ